MRGDVMRSDVMSRLVAIVGVTGDTRCLTHLPVIALDHRHRPHRVEVLAYSNKALNSVSDYVPS